MKDIHKKNGKYTTGPSFQAPLTTAVETITESEELKILSLVACKTINAVIITDAKNRIVWVNEGYSTMTGYTAAESIGKTPGRILQGRETSGETIQYIAQKVGNGEVFECELLNYHKNGTAFWMRMQAQPVYNDEGILVKYFGIGTDITEQKKLNEAITNQKVEEQKRISRAIFNTQEEERAQIGGELHDNVNQLLATVKICLGHMLEENAFNKSLLENCVDHMDEAIHEIRKVTKRIISPVSRTAGFIDSLEDLTATISDVYKIDIGLDTEWFDENKINHHCRQNLYRIIQEQLSNITKHANASSVRVQLQTGADGIVLVITDNGCGFNVKTSKKGVGIINILHRAASFNGIANLVSAPGQGCELNISIPFDNCAA